MPMRREENKREANRKVAKMVMALRKHWLEQVLDWPLKDGSLADRLTKTEVAALRRAAGRGKLFHGS